MSDFPALFIHPESDCYFWVLNESELGQGEDFCLCADVTDYIEHRLTAWIIGLDEPPGVPTATQRSRYWES